MSSTPSLPGFSEPFSPEHVPRETPHLESDGFLDRVKSQPESLIGKTVVVVGDDGIGKSLLARLVGRGFRRTSWKACYVGCREERSLGSVARSFAMQMGANVPLKGLTPEEMFFDSLEQVEGDSRAFMVLDDTEVLFQLEDKSHHFFSRVTEEDDSPSLALLLTLGDEGVLDETAPSVASRLRRNVVRLERYERDEVYDILTQRTREAELSRRVDDSAVARAAEMAYRKNSNCRYALDLIDLASSRDGSAGSVVTEDEIEGAGRVVPWSFSVWDLRGLTRHESLLLLALASFEEFPVTTGELETRYKDVCRDREVEPRGHTTVWKVLRRLDVLGFVRVRLSGEGHRGRTSLISGAFPSSSYVRRLIEADLRRSS